LTLRPVVDEVEDDATFPFSLLISLNVLVPALIDVVTPTTHYATVELLVMAVIVNRCSVYKFKGAYGLPALHTS